MSSARPLLTAATCDGCRCTDERACAGGCSWLVLDRIKGVGVCSGCPDAVPAFKERYRTWSNEFSGKNPERIGEMLSIYTSNRLVAAATRKAPGLLEIRLTEVLVKETGLPTVFQARVREEFVHAEMLDAVLAKITELTA